MGFEEYLFPRLGRRENLEIVLKDIKEFSKTYWVSTDKEHHLLYLSPTGETIIYPMFKEWIKNETDLPIKLFQIGSMFRPHKCGNVIINADELTTLLEGHSAHSSEEEAITQFNETTNSMEQIYKKMGLATLKVKRPKYGNNPVFNECVSFEVFLPSHKRSFAVGSSYYQGQIYSKPFGVKFSKSNGLDDFTYQTTFGLSERSMIAELQIHSDVEGLQMMPELSPEQCVILPFFDEGYEKDLTDYVDNISQKLNEIGIRTYIDYSKKKVTKKWRERGAPVRIGVDINQKSKETLRTMRRTSNELCDISLDTFIETYSQIMSQTANSLYKQSEDILYSHISNAYREGTLRLNLENGQISKVGWCGGESCAKSLEEKFPGEILGTMIEDDHDTTISTCLSCGSEAKEIAYFAKRCTSP